MAATLRYASTGTSYNGESFRVEIWDKNWTGGGFGFKMGAGGPTISYDTNGDEKFSKIITSKLEFEFMVESGFDATFINQMRNTYDERDVYVYAFNSSSLDPIWGGYIILDLGDEEDVSYPYGVKLKAIDGLSLLKDIDFVPDISVLPPYVPADTYGPMYLQKFTYWIKEILLKAGLPTSIDSSIYPDYKIKTSVNWYNSGNPSKGVSDDPLDFNKVFSGNFYKKIEDSESEVVKFKADNCYKVLEQICKVWGMRCVYWQGSVHFIQISEYANSETGTVANPVNITTRTYDKDGVFVSSAQNLGEYNALYDLEFESASDLGLQKLTGSNYSFYPQIKEVKTKHLLISNQNNFQSFPLLANGGENPTTGTHYYETSSLGSFSDAHNFDGFFSQIMIKFNNQTSQSQEIQMNWTVRARQVGNPTWQKMLDVNSSGNLVWGTFIQPTTIPYQAPSLLFQSLLSLNNGISTINILNGEIGGGNIPTDASFTGDWEFEYYSHTYSFPSTGPFNPEGFVGHGGIKYNLAGIILYIPPSGSLIDSLFGGVVTYSNVTGASSTNSSMFSPVFNGVVGSQSQDISFTTTSNSYVIDLKELPFGDNDISSYGGMYTWNGSTYVLTDFTGEWGVGTLSGTDTITLLLCKEILNNQQTDSYKLNATSALSTTNKTITSGGSSAIKVLNPIGRIKDKNGIPYVFLRGKFNLLTDECDGEWFEFDYNATSGTTTTTTNAGSNSGGVLGGSVPVGTSSAKLGQPTIPKNTKNVFAKTSSYVPTSSSPISSLDITEMLTSTFKIGDELELFDVNKNKRYALKLTRDYTIGETTLLFDPVTLNVDINVGSLIILNDLDLGEQYQRKTKGTVAGFDVDATSLEKGGVSIDGFLDSDTMTGASDTTLATSESIKAYVDSQIHKQGLSNYSLLKCETTTLSSDVNGENYAVVIKFDRVEIASSSNSITLYGEEGIGGIEDSTYCWTMGGDPATGDFEMNWNIATDTSVANNRILSGVKLQVGNIVGSAIVWNDLNPTDSYLYDRGNGPIRKGSTAASIIVRPVLSGKNFYRLMLWKERSTAGGTKAITILNGCQMSIKQIDS